MTDITSPTRTLDRAAASLPYGYFSARCGMLLVTLATLGAWLVTGFNVVEGAVPFIGIQWSTLATFSFFFYLLMVNFQSGGLRGLAQIKLELLSDIRFLKVIAKHPLQARMRYLNNGVVDPLRAALFSALICVGALFAFESLWVPLYDYFQFGSLMWPVYYAVTSFPPVILRNSILFLCPLFLVPLLFGLILDSGTKERFSVRYRINGQWLGLLTVAAGLWLTWIALPHQTVNFSSLALSQVIGPTAATFSLSNCYIVPAQHLFPQNTYTFYPCSLGGHSYTPPQILGFFDSDPWVHAVNVLTKFASFAAVCFPFMVRVRKNA
jgi:hypothetical protein